MPFTTDSILQEWAYHGELAAIDLLDYPSLVTVRQKQRFLKKYMLYPYMRSLWPGRPLHFTHQDYEQAREAYIQARIQVDHLV